jgi:hypothetical protein
MDDKRPQDENKTDDFKAEVQKATEAMAEQVAFWREFWKEWIPGGLRKRKRYRTKGHGARRSERRRKNKVARTSRKRNRPRKKRRN